MIARFITLLLIAVLAIPMVTLTRPMEANSSPWGEAAVAAKGKKHKKPKNPQTTTITRIIRQPVTQTFTNTERINVPYGDIFVDEGPADPYPSTIAVSGFSTGTITDVNLILEDFTHSASYDVDILLEASDGRRALVMSDVGSAADVTDIDLAFDDEAAAAIPDEQLRSGTFRPTDIVDMKDGFAAPAPAPNGSVALSTFDGAEPNGTWRLWVMDNGGGTGEVGDLAGWALEITAEVDVEVEEPAKDKQHKKKGKKRR